MSKRQTPLHNRLSERLTSAALSVVLGLSVGCDSAEDSSLTSDAGANSDADSAVDPSAALSVTLPNAEPGIGFDDLQFSKTLRKVIVPGGRSGQVVLLDPDDATLTAIDAFEATDSYKAGSYQAGPTSAVVRGKLAVLDKTAGALTIVDPETQKVESSLPLDHSADYVRYVAVTDELWVTSPEQSKIEIFRLSELDPPAPEHVASIAVELGPEALSIDETRGRAYTNSFTGKTYSIDLKKRAIVETWTSGCAISLGIALDESRGFAVIACSDGKLVALDVTESGAALSSLMTHDGLDVLAFSPSLRHVYAAAGASATLSIVGLDGKGTLSLLGDIPTAPGAKCVAPDDRGHAWVCDPDQGALLRIADSFAASAR